jgi:hypothetical protein
LFACLIAADLADIYARRSCQVLLRHAEFGPTLPHDLGYFHLHILPD